MTGSLDIGVSVGAAAGAAVVADTGQPRAIERRARPLLGTLVEVGVLGDGLRRAQIDLAFAAAFDRIAEVEASLSRFLPSSDIGRFNAAVAGACIAIGADTCIVLAAARALHDDSDGLFDVSLGSGADGWRRDGQGLLRKLSGDVVLDLGGIGKGHAVDCSVAALGRHGVGAGWVNAGGDLRAFGALSLPIDLRDESSGGVRRFGELADGALATSWLPPGRASSRGRERSAAARHVSVTAVECLFADALTKVVALSGDTAHPLLARHGAEAWLHQPAEAVRLAA